ncbi:MAG: hypothetical protein ACRDRZ_05810 [Pseudonocardiaceae bacterium]
MRELDPNDRRPPYQQVADALRTGIRASKLLPGEQLATLSEAYGVSVGTLALVALLTPISIGGFRRRVQGHVVLSHRVL